MFLKISNNKTINMSSVIELKYNQDKVFLTHTAQIKPNFYNYTVVEFRDKDQYYTFKDTLLNLKNFVKVKDVYINLIFLSSLKKNKDTRTLIFNLNSVLNFKPKSLFLTFDTDEEFKSFSEDLEQRLEAL